MFLKEHLHKRYRKHDLCVLQVNLLFLEAKVYCSLLHRFVQHPDARLTQLLDAASIVPC